MLDVMPRLKRKMSRQVKKSADDLLAGAYTRPLDKIT